MKHTDITHTFESSDGRKAHVVKILDKRVVEDLQIQEIGQELFQYAREYPGHELCIDFSGVDFSSSVTLGKFITLDKKTKANVKQPLCLAGMSRRVYEVFEITKLHRLFSIYETVEHYKAARGFAA